jgi:hypothetical protein
LVSHVFFPAKIAFARLSCLEIPIAFKSFFQHKKVSGKKVASAVSNYKQVSLSLVKTTKAVASSSSLAQGLS